MFNPIRWNKTKSLIVL